MARNNERGSVNEFAGSAGFASDIPDPQYTNCQLRTDDGLGLTYEGLAWYKFKSTYGLEARKVMTWFTQGLDYYRGEREDGHVIFYDAANNGYRIYTPEQVDFTMQRNWLREFSYRLMRAMNLRDMNQFDLAGATGYSQGSISGYLSGRRCPTSYGVSRMASALGCSVEYLGGF